MSDRGLVVVYTGKGKGKTTAALGIVLRAVGHGHKVGMVQFIKGEWYYGELTSSKRLEPEFEMIAAGKGFVGIIDDDHPIEEHQKAARDAVQLVKDKLASGRYDVMVLDEVNYAVKLNLITVDDVLGMIVGQAGQDYSGVDWEPRARKGRRGRGPRDRDEGSKAPVPEGH